MIPEPHVKTSLNLTFLGGLFPSFLSGMHHFVRNIPVRNVEIRPDYRRVWDIPVTTVRIVFNVGLSPFRTVCSPQGAGKACSAQE